MLKEWRDLLESKPNPNADELATKAEEVRKRLEDALARRKRSPGHGGNPPPEIGVTPKSMIAALSVQIGHRFPSRAGQPQISRMYDRVSEAASSEWRERVYGPLSFRGETGSAARDDNEQSEVSARKYAEWFTYPTKASRTNAGLPRVRDRL